MYEVLVSDEADADLDRIDETAKRVLIVHYYHTLQDYESDLLHYIGQ